MYVNLCHCRFRRAKGVIVYQPSCHLINFRNPACGCSKRFSTGQFFQSAFEFLYRFLMRSALPLFCLTVLLNPNPRYFSFCGLAQAYPPCTSRYKPWESLRGSSPTTPLRDFHHRLTAYPSYTKNLPVASSRFLASKYRNMQ